MGVASSRFTQEEIPALSSFSSSTPWAYDSPLWPNLWLYKSQLWKGTSPYPDFKPYMEQLVKNNSVTHNISTLCAHVCARLTRSWYFAWTDLEMTISSVILLRSIISYIMSTYGVSEVVKHLSFPFNPSESSVTNSYAPTNYNWSTVLLSCVEFISTTNVSTETYVLHIEVLTLVISLLTSQIYKAEILRGNNEDSPLSDSSDKNRSQRQLETLVAAAQNAEGRIEDPFLRALMLIGNFPFLFPVSTNQNPKSNSKPESQPELVGFTNCHLLVYALLRNIVADANHILDGRSIESDLVCTKSTESLGRTFSTLCGQFCASPATFVQSLHSSNIPAAPSGSLLSSLTGVFSNSPTVAAVPLSVRSSLLLLLLIHNFRAVGPTLTRNGYRSALLALQQVPPVSSEHPNSQGSFHGRFETQKFLTQLRQDTSIASPSHVNLDMLAKSVASLVPIGIGAPLFYTLFQTSPQFAAHLLGTNDPAPVLLPLLASLYVVPVFRPDHRYILLISVLILTQSLQLCTKIAERTVKPSDAPWCTELKEPISLAGLTVLCLLRTLQYTSAPSTTSAGDCYLHTNALAAVANLMPVGQGWGTVVSSRLVGLLDLLHRRRTACIDAARRLRVASDASSTVESTNTSETGEERVVDAEIERYDSLTQHFDNLIPLAAESLLALMSPSVIAKQTDVVYSLLYNRTKLITLADTYPAALKPLLAVVDFFHAILKAEQRRKYQDMLRSGSSGKSELHELKSRLSSQVSSSGTSASSVSAASEISDSAESAEQKSAEAAEAVAESIVNWSDEDVKKVILTGMKVWTGDAAAFAAETCKNFADHRYVYTEEVHPEVFFVPYSWSLVRAFTDGDLHLEASKMLLCAENAEMIFVAPSST